MEHHTFKPGQKVVCISDIPWRDIVTSKRKLGPVKDDIEIVKEVKYVYGIPILVFHKYPGYGYGGMHFRPIDEIDELLHTSQQEAESETIETPIEEPETVEV